MSNLEKQFGFTPEFIAQMQKQDERLAKLREELAGRREGK